MKEDASERLAVGEMQIKIGGKVAKIVLGEKSDDLDDDHVLRLKNVVCEHRSRAVTVVRPPDGVTALEDEERALRLLRPPQVAEAEPLG